MSRACDLGEAKVMGHSQRIAQLALAVAKTLGATPPETSGTPPPEDARGKGTGRENQNHLGDLAIASLLHDIGISSVTYSLYERLRGQERALLRVYPSGMDELLAAWGANWGSKEREVLHFILERHTEIGAGMVRHLGYGEDTAKLLEGHHRPSSDTRWGDVLAACDLVETWISALPTHNPMREADLNSLIEKHQKNNKNNKQYQTKASADVWEALRDLLAQGKLHEIWDTSPHTASSTTLEASLDALWGEQYSVWVGPQELETHLRLLAQVVDAQSPFTAGHTLDVTRLARRMGEHLGLSSEDLNHLSLAGLIHGVGRLGLPASIIEKSGGLSEEEFTTLHLYPNLTREALRPVEPLRDLVDAASTHREKLDGSGYPEGRTEGEIPLIGRILAVADTYNALISDRPYRSGYGRGRALSILRAEGTRLFHGLAIDALEAVCKEGF